MQEAPTSSNSPKKPLPWNEGALARVENGASEGGGAKKEQIRKRPSSLPKEGGVMCQVLGLVAEDMGVRERRAGETEGGVFFGCLGWLSGRKLTFPVSAAGSLWWGWRRTLGGVIEVRLGDLAPVEGVPCRARSQRNRSITLRPYAWNSSLRPQ